MKLPPPINRAACSRSPSLPDVEVSLECRCADDRGAGYKAEEDLTPEDLLDLEDYDETRGQQERVEELVAEQFARARAHVDVWDTDDEDSQHSDCYVRFNLCDLPEIVAILEHVGLPGDILDVQAALPPELAHYMENVLGWRVELGYNKP